MNPRPGVNAMAVGLSAANSTFTYWLHLSGRFWRFLLPGFKISALSSQIRFGGDVAPKL